VVVGKNRTDLHLARADEKAAEKGNDVKQGDVAQEQIRACAATQRSSGEPGQNLARAREIVPECEAAPAKGARHKSEPRAVKGRPLRDTIGKDEREGRRAATAEQRAEKFVAMLPCLAR
jgi:hypothetical protein